MKNIWLIFKGDIQSLFTNMISAIVVLGLVIVPPMYAWLTTLGFWDPYSNTGDITVAVANQDEGYSSDLIPTSINAGTQIVDALHENNQFHWVFEDEAKALEGVYSGRYYAAIVIPTNFTSNLMSVFSNDTESAEIKYYSNEKENAIAPHVTDIGATTLQTQIDETFTKTVASVALGVTGDLTNYMNGEGISNYAQTLLKQMDEVLEELQAAQAQTDAFASLVGSTGELIEATATILGDSGNASQDAGQLVSEAHAGLSSASSALNGITSTLNKALSGASSTHDTVSSAVDAVFTTLENDPTTAQKLLSEQAESIENLIGIYKDIRTTLQSAGAESGTVGAVDTVISGLERLQASLEKASTDVSAVSTEARDSHSQVTQKINEAKNHIQSIQKTYEGELGQQAAELGSKLESATDKTEGLSSQLHVAAESMATTADSLASNLEQVQAQLAHTSDVLSSATDNLKATRDQLSKALESNDLQQVRTIIGNNPEAIASFLSAPTELVQHPVYEMPNNGSAMSAFYTCLSLWIGSIFLVALTSVNLPRKRLEELDNPTPAQLYIGRYGVFVLIGLAQALIVCIGNVFFLGVQCEHLWLYLLAGCVAAIVFTNIIYTLTISFGNIGKAIAIILLVMQLAGSGGIFPVQMSSPFFQAVYPWLPFTHAMEALNSCIAGIYGNQYWMSLALLLAFLIPSLLLGLVLRRPIIRLNDFVTDKLDETKFI